jgi:N-acetylmuramoyl-L-alanine amidase
MITSDTIVVGVEPRMSRQKFIESLVGTPSESEAGEGWDRIVKWRVDPLFARAVFRHESTDGKYGVCFEYDTKSPGNTRLSTIGRGSLVSVPGKGQYVKHESWADGWEDLARRLVDPRMPYTQKGAVTIAQIIPIWAPRSDNNSPENYIGAVTRDMSAWEETLTVQPIRIAIAAGHHNSDGGNPIEHSLVGEIAEAYARALREAGCDVRVITPDGGDDDHDPGDGEFSGGLQQVAQVVVDWASQGWVADLFIETHTEGVGNSSVRGVFGIYPDWDGDVDGEARDLLIPLMVGEISGAMGIPVRGSGVMSERSTGVGSQGYRLGMFARSEPLKSSTTRLIIEHGSHSNPDDLSVLRQPDTARKIGEAATRAIMRFYGRTSPTPPTPAPQNRYFPETGHYIGGGFRGYWEAEENALEYFGYPISEEFSDPETGITVQWFERARFEWQPGIAQNPYGVVLGLTGTESMERDRARVPEAFERR